MIPNLRVGQMMDYTANSHHYWDRAELADYARETSTALGGSLEEVLLACGWSAPVEDYFEQMEANLREGRVVVDIDPGPLGPGRLLLKNGLECTRASHCGAPLARHCRDGIECRRVRGQLHTQVTLIEPIAPLLPPGFMYWRV